MQKKATRTSNRRQPASDVPVVNQPENEMGNSMRSIYKRFQSNIDQIEKRYCSKSSGLVFNLKDDNVEFDPDECTAENDDDLLNSVKEALHKHTTNIHDYSAADSEEEEEEDDGEPSICEAFATSQSENVFPNEMGNSMRLIYKRFQSNINQIEKRYCSKSSGLVFNLKDDNVEFDPDECTAENDEDLLNSVKEELHKHTTDFYGL